MLRDILKDLEFLQEILTRDIPPSLRIEEASEFIERIKTSIQEEID